MLCVRGVFPHTANVLHKLAPFDKKTRVILVGKSTYLLPFVLDPGTYAVVRTVEIFSFFARYSSVQGDGYLTVSLSR